MASSLTPEQIDQVALALVPGLGPRLTAALLGRFGSASAARRATEADLRDIPSTPAYKKVGDMRTDETGKQFTYDAWNRLAIVRDAGNVTLETNSYDGGGRQATTTTAAGTVSVFYSADWQALEESFGGTYTKRYVWSPVYVDAMVLRDGDTSGTGLTATGGNYTRLWPMQDANWDVAGLADGIGTAVERYDYTPFGVVTELSADYGTVRAASTYGWTQGFQGMLYDSISGTYKSTGRTDYSPTLGRWLMPDPSGLGPDINEYRMENDGPGNGVDPSGLQELLKILRPSPKEL